MNKTYEIIIVEESRGNEESIRIQKLLFKFGLVAIWQNSKDEALPAARMIMTTNEGEVYQNINTTYDHLSSCLRGRDLRYAIRSHALNEGNIRDFIAAAKAPQVREITMEELNALTEKTFGYQVKIKK